MSDRFKKAAAAHRVTEKEDQEEQKIYKINGETEGTYKLDYSMDE
jgi:hypothetical protein